MAKTPVSSPTQQLDERRDPSIRTSDSAAAAAADAGPQRENASYGAGPQETLRSVRCRGPADLTADRLERALVAAGIKVFARIDHAAEGRAVGLSMRPAIVIIFGNPKVGTPLMIARPTVAVDLPLRALVWEDETGGTWLTYNTPLYLEARHGLDNALASTLVPAFQLIERTCTAWR